MQDLNELSAEFFDELEDHEFYGDSVQHIYLYDSINSDSVQQFQYSIRTSQSSGSFGTYGGVSTKPKPIVVHINSPGGDATYGLTLVNILSEVRVPLAVIIDGDAASAATPLFVAAPYRVMNEYSTFLIHEYSAGGRGKRTDLQFTNEYREKMFIHYYETYKNNTNIPEEKLQDLLSRDKFLTAKECLD